MSPAGGGARAVRICGATKGFFVLERCGVSARAGCGRCQRSVCRRHTMQLPGDPVPVCPECYSAARGYVSDPNDDDWAIGYRRSFYWDLTTSSGDQTWWMSFDEVDREGFDQPGDAEGEWGVEGGEFGNDFDDDGYVDS